jgi:hypothetical protein
VRSWPTSSALPKRNVPITALVPPVVGHRFTPQKRDTGGRREGWFGDRFGAVPQVLPRVTKLTTEEGWCAHYRREVYSRHPLQTGRAGGAAAAQLGPRALALACDLNKAKGLSMHQTTAILAEYFGLKLTAGALAQLVQRAGRKLQP